jgi:hypothetical protein
MPQNAADGGIFLHVSSLFNSVRVTEEYFHQRGICHPVQSGGEFVVRICRGKRINETGMATTLHAYINAGAPFSEQATLNSVPNVEECDARDAS